MRLRTLPVSTAGVITASALALAFGRFRWLPAILSLVFAVLAQIASNFANEYFDYRDGLDAPGRDGPRRGVTEGDISPRAMLLATFITLALACADGLALVSFGGWWLIPAGIVIALGALAYSAGPYPLSRHALGEVAVIFFFGIVPVNLTFYVMSSQWHFIVFLTSLAVGFMGANVLIINNFRDTDADRAVGKVTLSVLLGKRYMPPLYLANAVVASLLAIPAFLLTPAWFLIFLYFIPSLLIARAMTRLTGPRLNPLLGMTAISMLLFSLLLLLSVFL